MIGNESCHEKDFSSQKLRYLRLLRCDIFDLALTFSAQPYARLNRVNITPAKLVMHLIAESPLGLAQPVQRLLRCLPRSSTIEPALPSTGAAIAGA